MGCECEKADLEIVKKGLFLGGKTRDLYHCKKCKKKHFEITYSQKEGSNMNTKETLCSTCEHLKVCKHVENMAEAVNASCELPISTPIYIDIRCEEFREKKAVIR